MGTIITRQAVATDAVRISAALDELRQEFGLTAQIAVPLPVDHNGPNFVLLAEEHNQIIGLVGAHRCHSLVKGSTFLLITDIYVVGPARKKGVATLLMNEVNALGRRIHCNAVSLIVSEVNNAALATASRAGYIKHNDMLLTYELD
jgi:GNAT superfamily N-acetyltransferase